MKSSIASQTKAFLRKALTPSLLATAIVLLGTGSSSGVDRGKQPTATVFPPRSAPYGKTYGEWSAAWWHWATAAPAASNPIGDQTGQNAASGQSGKVWFLAGNLGGSTVRTITVPSKTSLFFPILNTIYLGFPCDGRDLPGCEADQAFEEANDIASLLSFISHSMDGATLSCKIDGMPVSNLPAHRVQSSTLYSLTLPDENVFGLPAGPYHPCVDDGYFLMLAPLQAGRHTIHFAAANSDDSFSLNVRYNLTVLPNDRHGDDEDQGGDGK